MKASELRIGNWVDLVGSNSSFQIDTIYDNELSGIEPIPLTEEWLERFGFDSIALGYELDDRFITLRPEDDIDGGFDVFIMTADMEQPKYITYIDYVHQLQNLYHALTGQELKHEEHSIST